MEPGVEPLRIAQPAQVEPRLEEGVLDRIGGPLVVAQDEPRGGVQADGPADRQRGEGFEIASLRPDHQITLHRSTFLPATIRAASTWSGTRRCRIVPSWRRWWTLRVPGPLPSPRVRHHLPTPDPRAPRHRQPGPPGQLAELHALDRRGALGRQAAHRTTSFALMATFAEVEQQVAALPEGRHRGDAFERVVAPFLRQGPALGMRPVWTWLDWPGRLDAGPRPVRRSPRSGDACPSHPQTPRGQEGREASRWPRRSSPRPD